MRNLNIVWMPIPVFMKFGMYIYIMPPEAMSVAYMINRFHQWSQHDSLSNCWGITFNNTWRLNRSSWDLVLYHATWDYLFDILKKSLSLLVPALQPLKLLRMLEPLFIKLGVWSHLNEVPHKSLPPVIPTLQHPMLYFIKHTY